MKNGKYRHRKTGKIYDVDSTVGVKVLGKWIYFIIYTSEIYDSLTFMRIFLDPNKFLLKFEKVEKEGDK